MDARPSGWYDDPHDDDLLRYWDGVVWTEHTALKRPQTPPPAAAGVQDVTPAERGGHRAGSTHRTSGGGGWSAPGGAMAGSRSASGAWQGMGRIAADGRPYASWIRRVVAYLVDGLIVGFIALPFAWPAFTNVQPTWEGWIADLARALEAGGNASSLPAMPQPVVGAMSTIALITAIVTLAYEIILLRRFGATLGMRLLGFRVRQVGHSGPPGLMLIIRRTVIKYVSTFLSGIPVLGPLASGFTAANYLWPIWDSNRQALHDKAATTEVVRVRAGEKDW